MVITDRRLFMRRPNRAPVRPADVVWEEPFTGVKVERCERARMWMPLYPRRISAGRRVPLGSRPPGHSGWAAADCMM
jgi:hypothetical protein